MYFLSVIILYCFIFQILCRPSHVLEEYDKDAKEESYGDSYGLDSDDYIQNGGKSSLKQDENANNRDELDRSQLEKDYLENINDDQADSRHSSRNMFSAGNDVKRTAEYNKGSPNNEKPHAIQNNEFNEEETDESVEQARYFRKPNVKHSAIIDSDVSDFKRPENNRRSLYRDRREINKSDLNESAEAREISTEKNEISTNEDEEAAVRRHIKKLSKEELDELIQSLSDDKRALLKNIIDKTPQDFEIYKREITKKAGANEENSFVGNEQSDNSKIQGDPANIQAESLMSNTDKLDVAKTPNSEIFSKSTEIVSSSEKSTDKCNVLDGSGHVKLDELQNKENLPQTQMKIEADPDTEAETTKTKDKRELTLKSIPSDTKNENPELTNNDDLYCSENEDLSELWDEESKLHNSDYINKREISGNNEDSIRSLQESFPNSEDAINFKLGSNMAPLIRVKRNDLDKMVEKRDTNIISNLKVPYFSNTIENNEEENDEGSEFDDEELFDRRSNLVKSEEVNRQKIDNSINDDANLKCDNHNQPVDSNLEDNRVSLGSDTDAVLSGIEGVDDNMMYSSVSRNRRTLAESEDSVDKLKQKNMPKLITDNESNAICEQSNNPPRYQENDAFGSLPRNYEEELGRYKRIRRLKTLSNVENNDSI